MEYLNFNSPLPILSFDENSLFVLDDDSNIEDALSLGAPDLLQPEEDQIFLNASYNNENELSNIITAENLDGVFPLDDPNNPRITLIPPALILTELGDINQEVQNEANEEKSSKVDVGIQVSDLSIEQIFSEICDCCNQTFTNPKKLSEHVTNEKPFTCQICDKKFCLRSNLWRHVRTHTGEKPYKCPDCDRLFAQRSNMEKHRLVHSGERPYGCNECSRAFAQESNLNKHLLLHTQEKPFACDECDKTFTQRSNLRKHKLIHDGIKSFSCDVCGLSFSQRSNLKKHLNIHRDRRDYFCDYCHKAFIQKVGLQRHSLACKVRKLYSEMDIEIKEETIEID